MLVCKSQNSLCTLYYLPGQLRKLDHFSSVLRNISEINMLLFCINIKPSIDSF